MLKRGGRKAQYEVMYAIINVAMAIAVGFLMWNTAKLISSGDYNQMARHSREIALMIETAYSVNDDFYLAYPNDASKFNIRITRDKVIVYEDGFEANNPDKSISFETEYASSFEELFIQDIDLTHPNKIYFIKSAGKLSINDKLLNMGGNVCPKTDTKDIKWQTKKAFVSLVNDQPAGTNENNEGAFLSLLKDNMAGTDFEKIFDNKFDPNTDYLFASRIKLDYLEEPSIRIYYNIKGNQAENSQKLGCLIANRLASDLVIQNSLLMPITLESLQESDPKLLFFSGIYFKDKDYPIIYIEANINPDDQSKASISFKQAMVSYFNDEGK